MEIIAAVVDITKIGSSQETVQVEQLGGVRNVLHENNIFKKNYATDGYA